MPATHVYLRDLLKVTIRDGRVALDGIDAGSTPGVTSKRTAKRQKKIRLERLADLQERLFAEKQRSLLLVLQGLDTSGKDGTVNHVVGQVNVGGLRIANFKEPTPDERKHHFLWRIRRALPEPGEIGVFNRSHYEDVTAARLKKEVAKAELQARFEEINRFEGELLEGGTQVLKVFLHISKPEQEKRLRQRILRPEKRWKFSENDLRERRRWQSNLDAYEEALARTSVATPWFVIPADHKWYRDWAVATLLIEQLEAMNPQYPTVDLDQRALLKRLAA